MTNAPLPPGISFSNGFFRVDKVIDGFRYTGRFSEIEQAEFYIAAVKAGQWEAIREYNHSKTTTIGAACDLYVDELVRKSKSKNVRAVYKSYAKIVKELCGEDESLHLRIHHWSAIWNKIVERYSPSHANSISSFVNGMQQFAFENDWIDEGQHKSAHKMKRLSVPEGRKRYLSDFEEARCLDYLNAHHPDYVGLFKFYMDTGCRKSEAFHVEWRDVDHKNKKITFWGDNTKSGRSRSVVMTRRLEEYLFLRHVNSTNPDDGKALVFEHLSVRKFEKIWAAMRDELGLFDDKQFVIHAMRHTCCTRLLANGVDLITAQHWMGHSDVSQTAAYAHVMPNRLELAAQALDKHQTQIVSA